MEVMTTRFGKLSVREEDFLLFDQGLIGLESCRRWVLLADSQNNSLGWLQSVDRGDVAVGVVSPRRFVPDYQLRASAEDLKQLELADLNEAEVVVIVSRQQQGLSLNLRAPLVINSRLQRGCQVVAKDEYPVQHQLITRTQAEGIGQLRKSA